MIPADRIHFNDDGTAWLVEEALPDSPSGWPATRNDRPCDTCGGSMYVWPEGSSFRSNTPCPDCDGTGRHTFTIEVENDTYLIDPSFTYRVSVAPGMVLPIVSTGGAYLTSSAIVLADEGPVGSAVIVRISGPLVTYHEIVTLPPAAKPGMWAVKLNVLKA